ncbi:uncharacterized protein LOC115366513 isoform X2 [Myripristis murdjan]|uniref:uncharacterized protein LOC115366513 isoform X2 n=1 Tax=Myripristis murdjan TaxID=586833 RepID=UPI00117601A1|nr:uncharacterized protein LOC115366513 isoform X2 [Myripristis murdjan]
MCLWRCSIAIILGFVWYFSECGQTLIQYFLFSLCCLTAPVLLGNFGQESSTQTDEVDKDQIPQESLVEVDGENTGTQAEALLEPQYPHVKKSLQQVFECMYAELVLPWYHVPEPCESQPLHQALSREFDCVIERVVRRARDFDVCEAVVGSIRTLTLHLHNAKHSDREPLFSSRAEEIAVLREFSEALVRNLFPESLWCQDVNRCALNEIVALKGLELLVTWLSDPDNLNQLVVSQLDSVTPQSSVEELCASDVERASLASHEGEGEGSEVISEGAEGSVSSGIKSKKKGKKLKERLSTFVDKIKSKKAKKKKKMKEMEQNLMWRAMQDDLCADDDGTSREGSIHSQQDSDRDDGDLENYLACVQEDMMEFKLSYEMWRVGCWAVSIPCVNWENEELIFTIHLEEKNNPENLQWDIKKTNMDIVYFRNRWQHSANMPWALEEISDKEVSDEVQEEIRASVELFLQELVSDDLIGHTQPVFQFLCPLNKLLSEEEHHGGVWGLLSGLAYFLTPGQEEEETSSPQTETTREDVISPQPETTAVENCSSEKCANVTIPAIIVSQCDSPSDLCEDGEPEMEPQSDFRIVPVQVTRVSGLDESRH